MKDVGCIHVDCGAYVCSEVQSVAWPCHLLWSQHCKLRRKGIHGGLLLHWHRQLYLRRKRKLTDVIVYCREVTGLEHSLCSCVRQMEERYRVEEPEWVRKQSIAFGLR